MRIVGTLEAEWRQVLQGSMGMGAKEDESSAGWIWAACWNLWTIYFFSFQIFSCCGKLQILNQRIQGTPVLWNAPCQVLPSYSRCLESVCHYGGLWLIRQSTIVTCIIYAPRIVQEIFGPKKLHIIYLPSTLAQMKAGLFAVPGHKIWARRNIDVRGKSGQAKGMLRGMRCKWTTSKFCVLLTVQLNILHVMKPTWCTIYLQFIPSLYL
jgi:hypothetical protein